MCVIKRKKSKKCVMEKKKNKCMNTYTNTNTSGDEKCNFDN